MKASTYTREELIANAVAMGYRAPEMAAGLRLQPEKLRFTVAQAKHLVARVRKEEVR